MESNFDPGILKKLRVDQNHKILIINAPEGYLQLFSGWPADSVFQQAEAGKYDFVQVFGATRKELEHQLLQVKAAGKYDCVLWACYPKGGGKIKSDLKREIVWEVLDLISLRPVSQVALDDPWSALRGRPHEKVKAR
jgi:hypothetical protein